MLRRTGHVTSEFILFYARRVSLGHTYEGLARHVCAGYREHDKMERGFNPPSFTANPVSSPRVLFDLLVKNLFEEASQ